MIEVDFLKNIIEKPISGEWGNDGGKVKVIRTTNFTNEGRLDLSDVVERDIDLKKVEKKRLQLGDLIIEKSGGSPTQPVGRVVFFNEEGLYLCNNFTSVLRPKKDIVDSKYLLYLLFSNHKYGFTGAFQNKTTGIINLQLARYVDKLKIPLPPLEQQKKIAAIMDAADAYRQKTKALIAKYDELTQSLFLDMFGDPGKREYPHYEYKLEELANKITDGDHATPKRTESGYKLLSCRNVKNGYLDFSVGVDFVGADEFHRMVKRCNPERGDILISCSGTIGRTTEVKIDEPFVLVRSAALVKPKRELVNSTFLEKYLQTSYMQAVMMRKANTSSQANLFTGPIKSLPVLLPELDLQNQFAESVQAIEIQKAQAQASLEKAEELFASLLQRAFKGELLK